MRAQPAGVGGGSGHLGAGGGGVLEPPNALGVAPALGVVERGRTVLWCGGTGEAIRRGPDAGARAAAGGGGLRGERRPTHPIPAAHTTAPSLSPPAAAALTVLFSVGSAPAASSFCTVDGWPFSAAYISGVLLKFCEGRGGSGTR